MKKYILLSLLLGYSVGLISSQSIRTNNMEEVFQSVLQNNKELKAGNSLAEARKLEAKAENNLPDPEVSYVHQWGNKEGMGFTGEFEASQSFNFPTLYSQRSKLIKSKNSSTEAQQAILRQNILLQVENACIDLIYFNQLRSLLQERLYNAELLSAFYSSLLQKGSTNIIETNKIELEMLNARNEMRQNDIAIENKLEELKALNGGIGIEYTDTIYPSTNALPEDFESIRLEALNASPEIVLLKSNQESAVRQIKVSRQQWLPDITLGYRMNPSSGGERYNGVLVGVSIPLFANRNKTKQAKAERFYADTQLESQSDIETARLRQLWVKAGQIQTSIDEYSSVMKQQNSIALLNKAIQAGQISMIEYFANASTFYQSMQNYLQLQNEYRKTIAELFKYKL